MPEELYETLLRFHREVLRPDLERVIHEVFAQHLELMRKDLEALRSRSERRALTTSTRAAEAACVVRLE